MARNLPEATEWVVGVKVGTGTYLLEDLLNERQGVAVLHGDIIEWAEFSFGSIDPYLSRFRYCKKCPGPRARTVFLQPKCHVDI